jgi:hypothetical protein
MKRVLISQEKSVHLDVYCLQWVSVGRKHRTIEKHWLKNLTSGQRVRILKEDKETSFIVMKHSYTAHFTESMG